MAWRSRTIAPGHRFLRPERGPRIPSGAARAKLPAAILGFVVVILGLKAVSLGSGEFRRLIGLVPVANNRAPEPPGDDGPAAPALEDVVLAVRTAGLPPGSPVATLARDYISRCQEPAVPAGAARDRGPTGAGFAPRTLDNRVMEEGVAGRSQPTGLSTCQGITGLLAVGVPPEDPRVVAGVEWLRDHYTLDANPGSPRPAEGLYGYYYELARTLATLGYDRLRDSRGVEHDWRRELESHLSERQQPDGSWRNPEESSDPRRRDPLVITGYGLMTLLQTRQPGGWPNPPARARQESGVSPVAALPR